MGLFRKLGMDWFNYVIVGSGPAGVSAARLLESQGTCMVDVGQLPCQRFQFASLGEGLESGNFEAILGPRWEMLANLIERDRVHSKLRAPGLRHVAQGESFRVHDAVGKIILSGAGSYAAGGMSNAWGAQLLRYTEADLSEAGEWPIRADALSSYYADLEDHIGIAGEEDDISEFLGGQICHLPPVPIVPAAEYLLARYAKRKIKCGESRMRLGRSRLAVMTQPYHGYSAHSFGETEFFSTETPGIYTARRTLEELRTRGQMTYLGGHKLLNFREFSEHVEIDMYDCVNDAKRTIRAGHLLLGCGALHTARLVLLNKNGVGRPLPFIDHLPTLLPIILPRMFGSALPARSFPVQLVATLERLGCRDMITFYYPGGLMWTDLLSDIPLPMDSALRILGNLLGGMLVAQIWETSRPVAGNQIRLEPDSSLRIDYPERTPYSKLKDLLSALGALGAFSASRLASTSPPGWGFHYAGSLPMREAPAPFETHTDGRLWDSKRVRVIDGSVLPSLPAKNHSLTLMANSARIADETLRCGY